MNADRTIEERLADLELQVAAQQETIHTILATIESMTNTLEALVGQTDVLRGSGQRGEA